jgi:hypothetical protein
MSSMPSRWVNKRYCIRTLSAKVTQGKRPRSCGGPALLGEDDKPLPNMLGMTMK